MRRKAGPLVRTSFALLLVLLALQCVRADPVDCTVGAGQTYPTIQLALDGCNGGSGSVRLILTGQFFESVTIPNSITNLTITSDQFVNDNVTGWPYPENLTTIWHGNQHQVLNPYMAIYLQGIGIDGQTSDQPFFLQHLVNNNLTIDRCCVGNFSSNITFQGEACQRAVKLEVLNTRFQDNWGSSLYFVAMEDIIVDSVIFERCGGYNNYSTHYLKPSFVSEGVYIVTNCSQWLIVDVLPPPCIFYGDQNGMTRCRNGTLECYNVQETAKLRPSCKQVAMTYVEEGTGLVKDVVDYPLNCRVYRPCGCQTLQFQNTTDMTYIYLPIGDTFFYTGLRLNCTVENGTEPLNFTDVEFVTSFAGDTGVGQQPPLSDPTMGYSLAPGIYTSGFINNSIANCTCQTLNRSLSLEDAGLACDYKLGNATFTDTGEPIPLKCLNGTVANCSLQFLRCFALDDTMLEILGLMNSTDGGYHEEFCANVTGSNDTSLNYTLYYDINDVPANVTYTNCTTNTTLVMPDGTTIIYPNGSVPYQIVNNTYICLGYFPRGTNFTIILSGLNDTSYESICNTSSLFNNGSNCPNVTSDAEFIWENSTCDVCNNDTQVDSSILLVMACSPWHCPSNYTVTCTYQYTDPVTNLTGSLNYTYNFTVFDGNPPNTSLSWNYPNGTAMCAADWETYDITKFGIYVSEIVSEENVFCENYIVGDLTNPICDSFNNATNTTYCCYNQTMATNGTDGCDVVICVVPLPVLADVNMTIQIPLPRNETVPCHVNYTCEADQNVTTCSCVLDYVVDCLLPYIPGVESAAYHWDNIVNETSFVDLSNNRAQQMHIGLLLDRTTEWIIYNTSTILPDLSDERARLREIIKQSPQIYGRDHDAQYGLFGDEFNIAPYRTYCDAGCPLDFTRVEDFDCIVDASTPKPQVNHTYQTIQLAIDDGCGSILVNNYENFYTDQMVINNNVYLIASFDQACILNYGHEIHQSNLEIRNLCFIHPGDESVPVFLLKTDMDKFVIKNSYFDGGNVRGAGIIELGSRHWINTLIVNSTSFLYWNYANFILWRIQQTWFSHNLFYKCTGRVVDIVYNNVFRFHDNSLVDVRGVSNAGGNTMIRFMGRSGLFFWLFEGGSHGEACSPQAEEAAGFKCAIFNNVQTTDTSQNDLDDVCYTIVGGQITYDRIFDNFCVKARIGFQLRGLTNLTQATVPKLLAQNAGIRPSNFIVNANPRRVFDWNYDVYLTSVEFFFFLPYVTLACNYPCGFQNDSFPICTVNPNYDVGYVGSQGQQITPFGIQNITSYGFGLFHNASQALAYCGITRVNNVTRGLEVPIYFTGEDGGRMFRDSFDVTANGVSFYGALMPNESDVASCCFPRSQIFTDGINLLADNFTSCNMSYMRDGRMIDFARDMFKTNPRLAAVYNLNFTNNTFDGGNLPAYSFNRIINAQMGFDQTIYEADHVPRGGNRRPYLPTLKNMTVTIRNNVFQNFSSYSNGTLIDPDTGQSYNASITDYPFTDPLLVMFLSEESPSFGTANVDYNTFMDVDRRVADIRYALNTTFIGNIMLRAGGRSPGNSAVVYIQGNRKVPGTLNLTDNEISQSKPILSERTNSKTNPGYLAAFLVQGYDNGTLCIYNNTAQDLPIGLRFAGGKYPDRLLSCIDPVADPPQFYDDRDNLRRIYFYNRNLTGYVHWLVYAELYQDFPQTWIYCDDGCIADTPVACNVSLTDPAYVPTHPWWDTLVFRDINRAIERCALANRRVRVLPNDPPQDYVLTINPQFLGNESNCNYNSTSASTLTQVVFADVTDGSTNPVRIRGCGHRLPACDVSFENFLFVHDCTNATAPTWSTDVPDPSPLPLPRLGLINNTFDGQGVLVPAIAPLADDGLMIGDHSGTASGKEVFYLAFQKGSALAPTRGNLFINYEGPRVVNVTGRSCNVSMSAQFNIWDQCLGNCFWAAGIGGIDFDYNNFLNSGGYLVNESSVVYVNVCMPNTTTTKFHLYARYNQIVNDDTYDPPYWNMTANNELNGGYFTGFWFDPVPYDLMPVDIVHNKGNMKGICLREDHRPDHSSLLDPQAESRKIDLFEYNLFCKGTVHDVRFLKGPAFDDTVQSDLVLYRKYYCDDGCPKVNEAQMSILLAVVFGLLMILAMAAIFYCLTNGRPWMYWSGVMGRYIPVNPMRWAAWGVVPGSGASDHYENRQRANKTRNSQYGAKKAYWV